MGKKKNKMMSAASKLVGKVLPKTDKLDGAPADGPPAVLDEKGNPVVSEPGVGEGNPGIPKTQKKNSSRETSVAEMSPVMLAAFGSVAEGLALGSGHREWLELGADLVLEFPDLSGRQLHRHRHRWLMEEGGRRAKMDEHVGSWSQMTDKVRAQFNGAVALARVQVRRANDEVMF